MSSVIQFFVQGGFFMVLLVLCSIAALAIILLRGFALKRDAIMPPVIWESIDKLKPGTEGEGIERLGRLVQGDPSALGRIVRTGLNHLGWPKSENIEAVQTRARHEIVHLERGLIVLEVVIGIAPLLGLLGTVSGLVSVFATLGASEVADPQGIATGIAEALNTTIAGLAIAVPSLIAYSYFTKKIETASVEMESLMGDLLAKCYHQKPVTPSSTE